MDGNKLFVGNLPWSMTSDTLKEMFAKFGEVVEAIIITDRMTGRSKGFGFVTFTKKEDAQKAMDELNGTKIEERDMVVNFAKPREDRNSGGFRSNR
jgi:RNA recognition motif-containing protein